MACTGFALRLFSVFEGVGEGGLIGVFEGTAGGESASQPGHHDTERLQLLLEVECRGLALSIGVSGKDDFGFGPRLFELFNTTQEFLDFELLRIATIGGGDRPAKDMVETMVFTGFFD